MVKPLTRGGQGKPVVGLLHVWLAHALPLVRGPTMESDLSLTTGKLNVYEWFRKLATNGCHLFSKERVKDIN